MELLKNNAFNSGNIILRDSLGYSLFSLKTIKVMTLKFLMNVEVHALRAS